MLSPDPSISPLYHLCLLNPRWMFDLEAIERGTVSLTTEPKALGRKDRGKKGIGSIGSFYCFFLCTIIRVCKRQQGIDLKRL